MPTSIKNLDKCHMPSGRVIVDYKTFNGWNEKCEREVKDAVGKWEVRETGEVSNPGSSVNVHTICGLDWEGVAVRTRIEVEQMFNGDMDLIERTFREAARGNPVRVDPVGNRCSVKVEIADVRPFDSASPTPPAI